MHLNSNIFSTERFPFLNQLILHSRIYWSIRLRWAAVLGYLAASLIAKYALHIPLPFGRISLTLGILTLLNFGYYIILKILKEFSFFTELVKLSIHILVDLFFLTLLVHFSGGIENPIYLFYLFHVVLSSIIFPGWMPMLFTTVAVLLFTAMVIAEYQGWIIHYSLYNSNLHQNPVLIAVILIVFFITVYFTAYICMTFMHLFRNTKRIIDQQNKKLIETDIQKTRFFQFASHELKSPVIAIKASIDSVLKTFSGSIDEKALNLLSRSSLRAAQMIEIIKELLDLSMNRGLPDFEGKEIVHLKRIIEKIIQQEAVQAEAKRLAVTTELADGDCSLQGREDDFERIFRNLINNAIRYTPEGGSIKIRTEGAGSLFVFSVTDSGIGIAEDDLKKIFEEFYRSENARRLVNLGTGLGLSLAKRLLENYNGEIEVDSKLGEGSTFRVKLPLKNSG